MTVFLNFSLLIIPFALTTSKFLFLATLPALPRKLRRASPEQALAGQPAALAALRARQGNLGSETDLVRAFGAPEPPLAAPGC